MSASALLLDTIIKTALIVLLALAATAVLRRQSAALRHWMLAAAIVCAAATPLFTIVVPSWDFPRVEPPSGGLTLAADPDRGSDASRTPVAMRGRDVAPLELRALRRREGSRSRGLRHPPAARIDEFAGERTFALRQTLRE